MPQPQRSTSSAIPLSNRFDALSFDTESQPEETSISSSPPVPLPPCPPPRRKAASNPSPKQKPSNPSTKNGNVNPRPTGTGTPRPQERRPRVVIMGDSISKRIDSKRLLRNADVVNLSQSGRRIEQVHDDITNNRATISDADSLIIHVATNNLQRDNLEQIGLKLKRLSTTIKTHTKDTCEVAISSVINRKDNHAHKVRPVNEIIHDICDDNRWTYINNKSITNLCRDNLHPDDRGLSFLARNFQDFLRCVHPHLFPRTIYPKWVTALMT